MLNFITICMVFGIVGIIMGAIMIGFGEHKLSHCIIFIIVGMILAGLSSTLIVVNDNDFRQRLEHQEFRTVETIIEKVSDDILETQYNKFTIDKSICKVKDLSHIKNKQIVYIVYIDSLMYDYVIDIQILNKDE